MTPHKIIETINNIKKNRSNEFSNDYIENLIQLSSKIEKSVKFDFGFVDDIFNIVKYKDGDQLFENPELFNMPFKLSYFAYYDIYPKNLITEYGFLLEETTKNLIKLSVFLFYHEQKKWIPSPLSCYLVLSNPWTDNIWQKLDELNISYGLKGYGNRIVSNEYDFPLYGSDVKNYLQNEYDNYSNLIYRSLKILNCKNIVREKIKPSEKLNKKRLKSNKLPIYDYYVLNIKRPVSKRDYSEKQTPLSHNRVHFCRGHFKEYTKEHPLLGKHVGLYWWEPHVRGQNKDGVIDKDYVVNLDS